MDEHTHPAAEMVTLFPPPAAVAGTGAAEQHVEQLAARLGLGRAQLSALHAVMAWAAFLRPSTAPRDREALRTYLDVMGYLPADRKGPLPAVFNSVAKTLRRSRPTRFWPAVSCMFRRGAVCSGA